MNKRGLIAAMAAGIAMISIGACTPTVRVKVDPINIYAKLDAEVRIKLDREVQDLIQRNPNLF